MHIGLDDDIEDWLERAPKGARGKTRRAIRHQTQSRAEARPSDPRSGDYQGARTVSPASRAPRAKRKTRTVRAARTEPPGETGEAAPAAVPRRKRPVWKNLRRACFLLVAVLAAEGTAALLSSPHCAVSEVLVQGAKETPSTELDTICTSLVGQNFLRADRQTALARTRKIATVASATLSHDWLTWPPRLVLTVHERQPFARVGGGNNWWVVDESGVPFRPARPEDEKLYAVTGPRLEPHAGQALNPKDWKPVVEFAGLLNRDAARGGNWNLRRVYFDRHGFASLRLTGGKSDETLVQLGADGWPEKLQTARWALNDMAARGRHAESINLISSSVATWTPRTTTEEAPETTGEIREHGTPVAPPTSETPGSAPA